MPRRKLPPTDQAAAYPEREAWCAYLLLGNYNLSKTNADPAAVGQESM